MQWNLVEVIAPRRRWKIFGAAKVAEQQSSVGD